MSDLGSIWQDYGLEQLEKDMQTLFPEYNLSLTALLEEILAGDILGALSYFFQGLLSDMALAVTGAKSILIWILVLGIVSALMTHFIEIFDRHQIADMGFYFIYLLMSAILLKCFSQVMATAVETIESIVLFVKLLIPTYLLAVGLSSGTMTVSAYYQLLLLMIYGVQKILAGIAIPFIYSYCLLTMINGIWVEEKLGLLINLLEKCIGWILKASIGIVTGVSLFQSVVTPVIDSVKKSALQKMVSSIPGVGNAAEGVVELVAGSAVVIKNSIGVAMLILLIVLCAAPLFQIFISAFLLKGAAALIGIVSNKRITACVDRVGDACMMLFRTVGTTMLLFLITLCIVAATTNRGF